MGCSNSGSVTPRSLQFHTAHILFFQYTITSLTMFSTKTSNITIEIDFTTFLNVFAFKLHRWMLQECPSLAAIFGGVLTNLTYLLGIIGKKSASSVHSCTVCEWNVVSTQSKGHAAMFTILHVDMLFCALIGQWRQVFGLLYFLYSSSCTKCVLSGIYWHE